MVESYQTMHILAIMFLQIMQFAFNVRILYIQLNVCYDHLPVSVKGNDRDDGFTHGFNVPIGEWEKIPLLTAKTSVKNIQLKGFKDSRVRGFERIAFSC